MKGEKCKNNSRLKILSRCLFLVALSVFGCLSLLSNACSALNSSPTYYNARYSALAGVEWHRNIAQNQRLGFDYLYNYEWVIDNVPITGNTANIHFETNVVLHGGYFGLHGRFHNTGLLIVKYCGSSGSNVTLTSQSISSVQTDWTDSSTGYQNRTLTVYGDVVATGFSTGTAQLYCEVELSNGWAFAAWSNSDYGLATFSFEQQPTTIQFTNDNSEAYQKQNIEALNNLNISIQEGDKNIVDAINNQSENEKSEYQDQADANESQINSDVSDNQQQATTFLTFITSAFEAIRDSSVGSCNFLVPGNLISSGTSGRVQVNLCPSGYTTFINTNFAPLGSSNINISTIFGSVIMIVFYVSVCLSILHALKKLYNLFLGGSDNG